MNRHCKQCGQPLKAPPATTPAPAWPQRFSVTGRGWQGEAIQHRSHSAWHIKAGSQEFVWYGPDSIIKAEVLLRSPDATFPESAVVFWGKTFDVEIYKVKGKSEWPIRLWIDAGQTDAGPFFYEQGRWVHGHQTEVRWFVATHFSDFKEPVGDALTAILHALNSEAP